MKTKQFILAALVALFAISASAQQVNTVYFLENAPMRHTFNPAFQPVSNGFINFTPLGWMTFSVGNNSITMSDVLYVDHVYGSQYQGKTITPLHPDGDKQAFLRTLNNMTFIGGDLTLGLLNMGFRHKEKGYVTIGINERIDFGPTIPKSLFQFLLGGGMTNLTPGAVNTFSLAGLGVGAMAYTEIGAGYSYQLNDHWTIGGKLKLLLGQAHVGLYNKTTGIDANTDQWHIQGQLNAEIAGPINFEMLPDMNNKSIMEIIDEFKNNGGTGTQTDWSQLIDYKNIGKMLTPSGFGAALDFGFTYKPIENLQVSAAINDLGFIYWNKSQKYTAVVDTIFDGVGSFDYSDPAFYDDQGNFSTQLLLDSALQNLKSLGNAVKMQRSLGAGYAKMVSARLNIGLDANFWENRVGIGILSATRLYNARLYEEVTIGLTFRPANWFSIAASYSIMNNGKYSNIGAGLSFMPYDGINMTLAMDYIPTSYAAIDINGTPKYLAPDKAKMINLALGFSICWGSNHRDKDHDGVWDKIDMCPETPRGVAVDSVGCPLDEDHDGVPDYLDHCLGTPKEAIGFIDSVGCPLDSDGDGVPDFGDWCPNTPVEARGMVDIYGCPLDSDGDGVPDYVDLCPNTPIEARGSVDERGCPKDSDGDGVLDYLDKCPDTPAEARATVDENGCAKDSDGDGVEDWKDKCPNTPKEAIGHVDEKGCELDGDGDGVPDYRDDCLDTPAEARHTVNERGCAKDSDGDGVEDWKDECPNTPKEAIGHVDAKGCEIDSDGDGVPDYKDECPMVPGVKANKGCPEVKREIRNLLQKAMQGIEFETGKATIKPHSFQILDLIADIFIENSNYIVEVQGHTDNTGKAELNKTLSQKRAEAVMNYLIGKGVPAERLSAVGYGPDVPIADNKTKAGRAKNRRVEFKISFEEVHYETILDHADPQPAEQPAEAAQAETPAE